MSQFDRYDNPEIEKECDWEVFIDKENPNIVNVRFGRFKEITIPPKYQWEEGQYIRFLDIDSEKIQECDFSVNGVLEATIHYVRDGLVEIPNAIFSHHGNAQCFVKHVGEDNITVVKAISFIVNRREKPPEYVAPDDEQTFRQWVQEQLDKGLIADITEIPSEEDDGLNIINITMRDGYMYVFTIKNGSKGDPGPGLAEGGTTGQVLAKKSDEDYDTEWIEIPTPATVVQEEGQNTEDVMSQKAVSDSLESIRDNKMDKDGSAVEDNIAIFDANGNVVDSGVNLDNIQVECDDHLDTESENPVQNKVLADIIPYKADYTYVNSKVDELNTSIGTKASTTYVDTELAKKANASDVETALSGKADVTDLPDSDELVPSFSITEAGKVLSVANDGESTTWVTVESGSDLPDIQSGDAGKVLTVNQEEDGTEWAEVPKELPNVSSVDAGKVLQVSGVGQWVANEITTSSVVALKGAGAPTSSIVAKVGDLYRDTTTDKLYQCSAYSSPTTLLNKTVTFQSPLDFSGVSSDQEYVINFTYGTTNSTGIKLTSDGHMYYKNGRTGNWTQIYYNGTWNNIYGNVIEVTGGTDVENQALLNFVETNGNVSGTGSTWVEIKASDDRIPTVTSADENKVMTVNSSGNWTASNIPNELPTVTPADQGKVLTVNGSGNWVASEVSNSGIQYFSGSGAPTSLIVANVGDLYRDTVTNRIYQCSNYLNPSTTTDLTGLTLVLNDTLDFTGTPTGQWSYFALSYTSNNVNYSQLAFNPSIPKLSYQFPEINVYNDGWVDDVYKTITVTGGTDATNTSLINFLLTNSGNSGSSWVEVVALPDGIPTIDSSDEGKVLVVDSNGEWSVGEVSGLPTINPGDAGKVLTVNSGETGAEWSDISGVSFIKSSTDPTDHVGSKGDIYYNSTSDNLFVKTDNTIIGLEGHKFGYRSQVDASMITETTEFSIVFKYNSEGSNPETCTGLKLYANGDVAVFTNAYWQQTNSGVWTQNPVGMEFVSGTDLTNPLLVEWVMANAVTIDGQPVNNDYWLNFKDATLPEVSIADNGKLLGVDNGEWSVVNAPSGLPSTTASDEGKLLQVDSNGDWNKSSSAFEEEVLTFTLADNTTVTKTFLVKVVNS